MRTRTATLIVLAAALAAAAAASAAAPPTACQGMRVSYSDATATYSFQVSKLRVTGATCATARTVARAVATALLHGKQPAAKISGFTVRVTEPCPGCTPVWQVRATRKSPPAVITFEGRGGA